MIYKPSRKYSLRLGDKVGVTLAGVGRVQTIHEAGRFKASLLLLVPLYYRGIY